MSNQEVIQVPELTPYDFLDKAITSLRTSLQKSKVTIPLDPSRTLEAEMNQRILTLRELQSIVISGGRQNGKTEWIARNSDLETLVIVAVDIQRQALFQRLQKYRTQDDVRIRTWLDLGQMMIDGRDAPFKKIMVDDWSYFLESQSLSPYMFYKTLLPLCNEETEFLLIG